MSVYRDEPTPGGVTFAAQDSLPKLPIPDLASTCQRYLDVLRPLQSAKERAETRHAVDDFLRHDGIELHERLKNYASDKTSYIEQFCMPYKGKYQETLAFGLYPA